MDKNISEPLARSEESLNGVDSARKMVSDTIGSYKDVSDKVRDYTDSLKDVSGIIRDLIVVVKKNRKHLSDNISEELQGTFDKFTGPISSFNSSSRLLLDGFRDETGTLRKKLGSELGSPTSRLDESSKQIGSKFSQSADRVVSSFKVRIDESLAKLKMAVDEFDKDVDPFSKSLNSLLEELNQEFVVLHQENTCLKYLCIVILVVNVITLVGVFLR